MISDCVTITDSIAICCLNKYTVIQGKIYWILFVKLKKLMIFQILGIGNKLVLHCGFEDNARKTESISFDPGFKDKIHKIIGLKCSNWRIHVQAGRFYGIFDLDIISKELKLVAHCKLNHWISSIAIPESDPNRVFMVTSKNTALELKVIDNQMEFEKRSSCDNCTLYCSKIEDRGNGEWNQVRIYAGTALGEIQIWSPSDNADTRGEIFYRFCSPMVRRDLFFKKKCLNIISLQGVIFSITIDSFRNRLFTTSDDRSARFWHVDVERKTHKLEKTVFGHTARVFKSLLIRYEEEDLLLTIGEDSRLCCWNMEGLLKFRKVICHGAVVLWDVAFEPESGTIYTSSSDGNLNQLFSIKDCMKKIIQRAISEDNFVDEYPAKVRFLASDCIVCVTNLNTLKLIQKSNEKWNTAAEIKIKITVLETFKNWIAVAGFKFLKLYLFDNWKLNLFSDTLEIEGLIRSVHFLSNSEILVVNDNGKCLLINENMEIRHLATIPKSKESWTTSAIKLDLVLLAGDRNGNLFSYIPQKGEKEMKLCCSLKRVHGSLGITVVQNISQHDFKSIIITSGHDGTLKKLSLNMETGFLEILQTTKVPVLWIERVLNETVFGFNDNHFIAWNRDQQYILEQHCGGGHRYWDLITDKDTANFMYIKKKKIFFVTFPLENGSNNMVNPPKLSWHTNSTNILVSHQTKDNQTVIISGGEDNLVKIHLFSSFSGSFTFVTEISTHISNVRALAVRENSDGSLLVFSGGGRAQICISKIFCQNSKCEVEEKVDFMLKSSDLLRNRFGKNKGVDFDPETRIMSLAIKDWVIYVGCSDGFLRKFHYDFDLKSIELLSSVFYGRCILNLHIIEQEANQILLTMGTDGLVSFWDIQEENEIVAPFAKLQHHDSGINCFDIAFDDNEQVFWLATGGDDQKITVSKFRILKQQIQVIETISLPYEHTAQVSGLKIVDKKWLFSVANDQQIFKFDLTLKKAKWSGFTSVSDVKGLNIAMDVHGTTTHLIISGDGVDFINYKCTN